MFSLTRNISMYSRCVYLNHFCRYATKGGKKDSKAKSPAEKIVNPDTVDDESFVDLDTEKLINYCCVNYVKEGENIKLKPDSEYPSWLFELRLGPPPELEELDPNYYQYWQKLKEIYEKQMEMRKHARFRSRYIQQLNLKKGDYEIYQKAEDKPKELH